MKSFVKKVAALAIVFSMASSTLANAQEEDGKVSFSVQGDLVSSYIWRGFYQTGASFQPTLSLGVGNFSLTAWGSTDFQGANSTSMPAAKEIDLTAAYTFGSAGPTLSVASLWWAGQGSCRYFNFKSHETDHHFEAGLAYTLPIEKLPLSITWNFMFAGQDKDENGNQICSNECCIESNERYQNHGFFLITYFYTGNLEPSHGGCPSCLGNFFKTLI